MPIVYEVINLFDGKRYIGHTAQRLKARRANQAYKARKGIRTDPFHLALREHGIAAFEYGILAELDTWEETLEEEKRLIRILQPEYNTRRNGESPGHRRPPKIHKRPDRRSLPGEEWRPIEGYEGRYEVSSLGRARSLDFITLTSNGRERTTFGRILKLSKNNDGYLWIVPGKGNSSVAIHVAIAKAFLGPRPIGMHALHKDDDKSNCRIDNLYYGTPQNNMDDRTANGYVHTRGPFALSIEQVREIKLLLKTGETKRGIARRFKVSPRTIHLIHVGRTYRYV